MPNNRKDGEPTQTYRLTAPEVLRLHNFVVDNIVCDQTTRELYPPSEDWGAFVDDANKKLKGKMKGTLTYQHLSHAAEAYADFMGDDPEYAGYTVRRRTMSPRAGKAEVSLDQLDVLKVLKALDEKIQNNMGAFRKELADITEVQREHSVFNRNVAAKWPSLGQPVRNNGADHIEGK